jgi:hypothetical protein
VWAFGVTSGDFFAVAVPMLAIFGLRRFLIARAVDANQIVGVNAAGAGLLLATGPDMETV